MSNLTRDTVLERLPEVRLILGSDDTLQILLHGRVVDCGTHALSVLEAFASPTRLADALSQLSHRTRGALDWIELTGTIERLYADGVLRRPDRQVELRREAVPRGFGSAEIHARMLNDTERTGCYIQALATVVRPGDIVVDIGTGTGILALVAARAGASRVYAIEADWIGRSAQDLFEANGYADRIRLVRGWSTQLELPERADLLVSEVIGNDPLGERVLEITLDARRRLLKSDARLVPSRLRIYGLAVTIPPQELRKRSFLADNAAAWGAQYGFDFAPLVERAQATPQSFLVRPHIPRSWPALAQPVLLAQIDLAAFTDLVVDHTESTEIATAGHLDGVVVFFELELAPGVSYSTDPARVDERCSWRSPVWVFADPLEVEPGDRVAMTYTYGIAENWGRVHVARA